MHISVCASMCRHRSTADLYPCIICRLRTNAVRRPCLCAPTGSGKCTGTRLTHATMRSTSSYLSTGFSVMTQRIFTRCSGRTRTRDARYNKPPLRPRTRVCRSFRRSHTPWRWIRRLGVLVHGCAECDTTAHIAPLTHHETSRLSIAQCSLSLRRCPSLAVRRPRLSVRVH